MEVWVRGQESTLRPPRYSTPNRRSPLFVLIDTYAKFKFNVDLHYGELLRGWSSWSRTRAIIIKKIPRGLSLSLPIMVSANKFKMQNTNWCISLNCILCNWIFLRCARIIFLLQCCVFLFLKLVLFFIYTIHCGLNFDFATMWPKSSCKEIFFLLKENRAIFVNCSLLAYVN